QVPPNGYPNVPAGWVAYGPDGQPVQVMQPMPQVVQPMPTQQPACETVAAPGDVAFQHWYFTAQAVSFVRDNYTQQQRIWGQLSTQDLQFDSVAAPYATLGYRIDPHNQWQLIYFNALGMSANANARDSGVESDVNYDSNFHSAELNYLYTWNHWS